MNDTPFEDCRSASEYLNEEWIEENETLFTLPEIFSVFQ